MNNKNMVFLLLAVVVAAMAIILLTRPEPSNVEGTRSAVAEAPSGNTGTESAVPAASEQTAPAQHDQARPAPSATASQTLPGDAPAPAVQPPALPEVPAAPGTPVASGGESAPRAAGEETASPAPVTPAPVTPAPATPAPVTPEAPAAAALPQSPRPGQAQTPPSAQAQPVTQQGTQQGTQPVTQQGTQQSARQAAQPASQPASQQAAQPSKENSLSIMALRFAGQGMILKIQAESAFTSKTFALTAPDRLVVDLGGEWSNMRAPMVPDNNLIKGARTGRQESAARLVLDLIKPLKRFETVRVSPTEVEIHME